MRPSPIRVPETISAGGLALRALGEADAAPLLEALSVSWEELRAVALWAKKLPTLPEETVFCRRARQKFLQREELSYVILERETGVTLGGAGLHHLDWEVPRMELGYWIRSDRKGEGFASKAASALTDMAFVDLAARRVEIRNYAHNKASRRVASKLGFTLEAVLQQYECDPQGQLQDLCIYTRLA